MFKFWLLLIVSVGMTNASQAQLVQLPDWDTVEIKTFDLGSGIYMIEGFGGNMGVSIGDDGVFLIDDQYAPLTAKISATIKKLSDQPIRFVINTHWHGDHTGGNENLGKQGALIVAHDNARTLLALARMDEVLNRMVTPSPESLPIITFNSAVTSASIRPCCKRYVNVLPKQSMRDSLSKILSLPNRCPTLIPNGEET
jgi:hypothetical protein